MVSPVGYTYACASGQGIYGGFYNSVIGLAARNLAVGAFVEIDAGNLNVSDGIARPNEGAPGSEITDWTVAGVYDADRHAVYVVGAHANTQYDATRTAIVRLSVESNTWDAIRNPWGIPAGHCYDGTAYHNDIIYKSAVFNGILRYNVATNTALPVIPNPPTDLGAGSAAWSGDESLTVHPNMGESGSMIWLNSSLGRTCRYDLATEEWSILNQTGNVSYGIYVGHYSAVSDIIIYGRGSVTEPLYFADASGVVTATSNCPTDITASATGVLFAASPNTPHSILIMQNGDIHSLSHETGLWTYEGVTPDNYPDNRNQWRWIAPLDDYGVFMIVDYTAGGNSKVYLYRFS